MSASVDQSLQVLRARGVLDPVDVAVLLGFGLGGIGEGLADAITIPYADLPGLPVLDEPGQMGRMVVGKLEGVNICCLQGQGHFYNSGDPASMSGALELVKALGARQLLIFAAAGSARQDLYPGNLAMVTDHINFSGLNPLIGLVDAGAFFSLNEAYDARIQRRLKRAAAVAGVTMHEGVFMWVSGPTFATPAEGKMARQLGGDLLGFGVAPEIILARRIGLRAGAVTVVTHLSAGLQASDPTLADCQHLALAGSIGLRRILRAFLKSAETLA
jgi:purine-nucleoside phosphorylase